MKETKDISGALRVFNIVVAACFALAWVNGVEWPTILMLVLGVFILVDQQ
jgi:hypothetical protein